MRPLAQAREKREANEVLCMKLTRKQWLMLTVLVLGAFVTVLNQTLVTPALPSIMVEMSIDQSTAQ